MKRIPWASCVAMLCCAAGAAAAQPEPAEPAPAAAAAEHGDPAKVAEAIRQLGAAEFAEREAAVNKLLDIGMPAVPALKKAAEGGDPEVEARARETMDLLALGVTGETPGPLRKLAVGALRDPDPRVRSIGLTKLAEAGPHGRRILQYMRWCHDVPADAVAAVVPRMLGGTLQEAVAAGHMDRVLAVLSLRACGRSEGIDAYVGTCFAEGALPNALARAEEWYALRPRRETALLAARLNWASDRRPEALRWARAALTGFPPENLDEEKYERSEHLIRNAVSLLAAGGDMIAVADFCENLRVAIARLGEDQGGVEGAWPLHGPIALAAHLAGDAERRDRNLDALAKAAVKAAANGQEDLQTGMGGSGFYVGDIFVLCRQTDQALRLAVEMKDFRMAASVLIDQGKLDEAEVYAEKRRVQMQDTADDEEVPTADAAPTTAEGWLRASWKAQWKGDEQGAVAGLRKAVALVKPDTDSDTVRSIYGECGRRKLAEETAALTKLLLDRDSPHYAPAAVAQAESGSYTAGPWCVLLAQMRPDAPPRGLVDQAVQVVTGKLAEDALLKLAKEAAAFARAHADAAVISYGPSYSPDPFGGGGRARTVPCVLDLLADTCADCHMPAEAAAYLAEAVDADGEDRGRTERAAWLLVDAGQWAQAADAFERARKAEPSPELRYYQAWALTGAGKAGDGERERALAVREARVAGVDLTDTILRTDDLEGGLTEWRLQRRFAIPPLGVPQSTPLIAEMIGDYRQACADRRQQIIMYAVFGEHSYSGTWAAPCASYLDVDGALARMQAGEKVDVDALCERYLHNSVGDQEGAILLVRGLDQFGYREQADRVYAAAMAAIRARMAKAPKDMADRNRLAWLSGACGRDLDEALRVAEALVAEQPYEAAYLDTLGTVYHSRGEYRKAVDIEAKAVADSLDEGLYYEGAKTFWLFQLARFKAALAAEQQGKPGAAKEE